MIGNLFIQELLHFSLLKESGHSFLLVIGLEAVSEQLLFNHNRFVHIRIQADRLRLEPDFTGKQKEKRCISCQILCRTYIMLIVLIALLQRNEKTGEVPLRKALEQLGAE